MGNRPGIFQQDAAAGLPTRLTSITRHTARIGWLVVTITGIAAFLAAFPTLIAPFEQPSAAVRSGFVHLGIAPWLYAFVNVSLGMLFVIGFVTAAGLIYARKSDDRMALFVAYFLVAFGISTPLISSTGGSVSPILGAYAQVLNSFAWFALNALFYLFPDGCFTPRWTWIPLALLLVFIAFASLPPSIPLSANHLPGWIMGLLLIAGWGTAIYAQVYRYRRISNSTERQQTKWVVYGLVMSTLLTLALSLPTTFLPGLAAPGTLYGMVSTGPIVGIFQLLIPASLAVAALRMRLWDIDPIINRTLVYGLLTAVVVIIYILIVGGLGLVFESQGNWFIALLATGLIAVLFQPLREQLQRGVNHLMYGERDDPYRVLSQLGNRLEAALSPEMVLPVIVETVARSLKLPYVAVALQESDGALLLAATYPPHQRENPVIDLTGLLRVPLAYQQEHLGELRLAPRSPGEVFSSQDRRLLNDLAHPVSVAAHSVRLTANLRRLTEDLQRSRERLVLAREEERRRIRRDLHDGLGPTLAALALSAGSVADLAESSPQQAAELAREMQAEIRASITDIRRLVYELRPPALDEMGLVSAIRDRAEQISHASQAGLSIQVAAPESFSALPAAVEVAAYRIVLEALTNVVRHAGAQSCLIRLSQTNEAFEMEIVDDGIGLKPYYTDGVGLLSMRERASELGGNCEVTSTPGQGTRVWARLPVAAHERKPDV